MERVAVWQEGGMNPYRAAAPAIMTALKAPMLFMARPLTLLQDKRILQPLFLYPFPNAHTNQTNTYHKRGKAGGCNHQLCGQPGYCAENYADACLAWL